MAAKAKVTIDHDEIRAWTERHGGRSAAVKGTGSGDDPGILRVDFPGDSGEESLRPIAWEEFFEWFDQNQLALIFRPSDRFNQLVSRESVREAMEGGESRRRSTGARRGSGVTATSATGARNRKPARGTGTRAGGRATEARGKAASGRAKTAAGGKRTPLKGTRSKSSRTRA